MSRIALAFVIAISLSTSASSDDQIKALTNGACSDYECMQTYNIRMLTDGRCSDHECMQTYNIRMLTDGRCSDHECMQAYNIQTLTNGRCSDSECLRRGVAASGYSWTPSGISAAQSGTTLVPDPSEAVSGEGGTVIGGPLDGSLMPGAEGGMVIGGPLDGSLIP